MLILISLDLMFLIKKMVYSLPISVVAEIVLVLYGISKFLECCLISRGLNL
jgi:hypothetical protein